LNNRSIKVADKEVSPVQTTFIQDRFVLDGVVVLHEVIHEIHKSKDSAVLFKVDFEQAYDKISWDILERVMIEKGFPSLFVKWVKSTIQNGKVGVMVNEHT
jgi:hypothetical protein